MRTMGIKKLSQLLAILSLIGTVGCSEKDFGKVDQGRTISFDKDKKTVTFIRDISADPAKPDYSHLPPVTYQLPSDPAETGPDPKAGLRIRLDTAKSQIVIFDPATQNFKTIPYQLVDQKEKVEKDFPLVFDRDTGQPKKFPVVDRDQKTITLYSSRQKTLTRISVPDEYLVLPDFTWDSGDEVRVYYKEEGKALRFMNITKADLFKH
jgi:hypothetical protein